MWLGIMMSSLIVSASGPQAAGVHLARTQDGMVEVALLGAVEGWKAMPWKKQGETWSAPAGGPSYGGVRIGDAFSLRGLRNPATQTGCKVVSFVTRSVAYDDFGSEDSALPSCGTAQRYAQLDCKGVQYEAYIAVGDSAEISAWSLVKSKPRRPRSGAREALSSRKILASVRQQLRHVENKAARVQVDYSVAELSGHSGLQLVEVHRYTGEAYAECGGPDLSDQRWAMWNGKGVVGSVRQGRGRPVAVFSMSGQDFMVLPGMEGGWAISTLEGEELIPLFSGFCGCSC
jgi:hypothetical protein